MKQIKTTYIKEVLSPVGIVNPRQCLSALKETMKASNTVLNMCVQVQHLLSSAVRSVHVSSLNLLYHAAVISGMVCACLVIKSSLSHSLHHYVLAHSSRTLIAEMFDLFFFLLFTSKAEKIPLALKTARYNLPGDKFKHPPPSSQSALPLLVDHGG